MFTGIIQQKGSIVQITDHKKHKTIEVLIPNTLNLVCGASVSINGVCLTVTSIKKNIISFDIIPQTLSLTNLGQLKIQDFVNIERSAKWGDEIGGHIVSGHIDTTAQIKNIKNNSIFTFQLDPLWMEYIFPQGFIAINGTSLTIVNPSREGSFEVHIIPETFKKTTFQNLQTADTVNIEIENQTKGIVNTTKNYLNLKND